MVSRFLVTTALEETWPTNNESVLFLGEWCRLYSRKAEWEAMDAVVATYHWDDRKKLHSDYLYLQVLHEELLIELSANLNAIHGVAHSIRYWRIIIGPWLGYFTQVLFDRWSMVKQVLLENEISGVRVRQSNQGQHIPIDMTSFISMIIGDDWNEYVFGQVLEWMDVPSERLNVVDDEIIPSYKNPRISIIPGIRRSWKYLATRISAMLSRDNEYFFTSSYLPLKQNLYLQARLGQIPKIWRSIAVPNSAIDFAKREWQLPTSSLDEFPRLVRKLLGEHIPSAYLEGYADLVAVTKQFPFPIKPSLIYTCNAHIGDDVFKTWAAENVEAGVPLVIGQHGGNFGMALWSFIDEHQIAIADRFLTWGWSDKESNKVTPVGSFIGFGKSCQPNKDGVALLVEMSVPRYSYHMYSSPVGAGQTKSYFADQHRFIAALPAVLRPQVVVRLYSTDYGYGEKQQFQERSPNVELDEGFQSMAKLVGKARLCIGTYNATTYLESMSLNFPTIIFWNPKHWELRSSAIPFFEKLRTVGILHDTPESAALHMATVWDDVEGWWESVEVQLVRSEFCERYARLPEKPLAALGDVLQDVALKMRAPPKHSAPDETC